MLYVYGDRLVMYGSNESLVMRVKVTWAPPVILCKYISGESPTESSVRPSGEIDAARPVRSGLSQRRQRKLTMVHRNI